MRIRGAVLEEVGRARPYAESRPLTVGKLELAPPEQGDAESGCHYFGEVRYPVRVGLSVVRVGTSSVTYRPALFAQDEDAPAAVGRWVHVYVDRDSRRPVPVPEVLRSALDELRPR